MNKIENIYIKSVEEIIKKECKIDKSKNILFDAISAILGDKLAAAKIIVTLAETPFFINDKIFWEKLELFMNGVFITEEDLAKMRAKLTENGKNNENPYRLLKCIERTETKNKIDYLINVTRCLLADFIDIHMYFRICNCIANTLDEDLLFMSEHLKETDLDYSINIQGLLTNGLAYQSRIESSRESKYSFTPIAMMVDCYAVSYNDVNKYPNPTAIEEISVPKISIPNQDLQFIEEEEIEKQF